MVPVQQKAIEAEPGVNLLHRRSNTEQKLKPQYNKRKVSVKIEGIEIIDVQNLMCRSKLNWVMLTSFSSLAYFFIVNIYILLSRCWGEEGLFFLQSCHSIRSFIMFHKYKLRKIKTQLSFKHLFRFL